MTSLSRDPVRTADIARRRTLRAQLGCHCYPVCESVAEHEASAARETERKARQVAATIAKTPAVERLLRFTVERVGGDVRRLTTERELFQLSERGPDSDVVIRTSSVALLANGSTYVCRTHPDACDCARIVLNNQLAALLGAPSSETQEPFPGAAPERTDDQ